MALFTNSEKEILDRVVKYLVNSPIDRPVDERAAGQLVRLREVFGFGDVSPGEFQHALRDRPVFTLLKAIRNLNAAAVSTLPSFIPPVTLEWSGSSWGTTFAYSDPDNLVVSIRVLSNENGTGFVEFDIFPPGTTEATGIEGIDEGGSDMQVRIQLRGAGEVVLAEVDSQVEVHP